MRYGSGHKKELQAQMVGAPAPHHFGPGPATQPLMFRSPTNPTAQPLVTPYEARKTIQPRPSQGTFRNSSEVGQIVRTQPWLLVSGLCAIMQAPISEEVIVKLVFKTKAEKHVGEDMPVQSCTTNPR